MFACGRFPAPVQPARLVSARCNPRPESPLKSCRLGVDVDCRLRPPSDDGRKVTQRPIAALMQCRHNYPKAVKLTTGRRVCARRC